MTSHVLHLGDCLDPISGLASLPDKSVDHVICDPPYLGARGESWEGERVPLSVGYAPATIEMLAALVAHSVRLSRGWVLVFNDYAGQAALRSMLKDLESDDLLVTQQPIVWVKPPGAFTPNGSAYSPASKQVEFIVAARRRRLRGHSLPGAYVSSSYSPEAEIFRTGGKPLSLMESIVRDFTLNGDVVLDPFSGAGTTGVACKRMGRSFIGWEVDASCHELAVRRIASAREQLTLWKGQA